MPSVELTDGPEDKEQDEVVLGPEAVLKVDRWGCRWWCSSWSGVFPPRIALHARPTDQVQNRPEPTLNGSISVIRGSHYIGKNH